LQIAISLWLGSLRHLDEFRSSFVRSVAPLVGSYVKLRTTTIVVCVVDAAAWCIVAVATILSGSDAATRGLDQAAGVIVTALYLVTGAPALVLVLLGRAPTIALVLALAFPAVLTIAFLAAVIVSA